MIEHTSQNPASPAEQPASVSASLRVLTAEHHRRAEQSAFQRRFVRGQLPLAAYTGWLGQMLCLYRALESHLAGAVLEGRPRLGSEPWRRTADLESDLSHFSVSPGSVVPLPATAAFLGQLNHWAQTDPPGLLGVLYVLEGSTNGSRHIARVLRSVYGVSAAGGLRFMDPYGDKQPERWASFKLALDAEVEAQHTASLITAAQATFDAVTAIGIELAQSVPPLAEV